VSAGAPAGGRPELSVVAPVHNEQALLGAFHARVCAAVDPVVEDWELVLVDDGSTDDSPALLAALAAHDPRVRVLTLSRNFGHQAAITAGIDTARGRAVVLIDSDLQDPPEVIPAMLERWRGGAEVVYGVRTDRAGERRSKTATARWYYRLLSSLSDTPVPEGAGDFRLLDARVVAAVAGMRETDRYLRGMVAWAGFRQEPLPYARDARAAGETKYTWRRMVRLAFDGITGFSDRPLRLVTGLGFVITALAFAYSAWVVVSSLVWSDRSISGYPSLMAVVLFLGGVQLLSVGILGTYVGRIHRESKRRPLYLVAHDTGRPGPGPVGDGG
jgi:glycosyltransferase involved in cell wall biosynthesis